MAQPQTSSSRLEPLLRIAQIVSASIVLPALGWAWQMTEGQSQMGLKLDMQGVTMSSLHSELEGERHSKTLLIEELRAMRTSLDSLKSDLLQRLTRVETRIEAK